jgi:hypothetical protein
VTIEQLILALQGSHGDTHAAWQAAAEHLLRIAGGAQNPASKT